MSSTVDRILLPAVILDVIYGRPYTVTSTSFPTLSTSVNLYRQHLTRWFSPPAFVINKLTMEPTNDNACFLNVIKLIVHALSHIIFTVLHSVDGIVINRKRHGSTGLFHSIWNVNPGTCALCNEQPCSPEDLVEMHAALFLITAILFSLFIVLYVLQTSIDWLLDSGWTQHLPVVDPFLSRRAGGGRGGLRAVAFVKLYSVTPLSLFWENKGVDQTNHLLSIFFWYTFLCNSRAKLSGNLLSINKSTFAQESSFWRFNLLKRRCGLSSKSI